VTSQTLRAPFPFSGRAQHRACLLTLALILLIFTQTPAATLPQLQTLITQLGSDDPHLREAALDSLMDLHRPDLSILRAAAMSQSPLMPGQVDALRQAVAQIFLAGEPFKVDPQQPGGFLGVLFPHEYEGAIVQDRIRGFPGYRYLQAGDVIVKLLDRPSMQIHNYNDFINAVAMFNPGETLHLLILRYGREIAIAVPLDYKPMDITPENISEWADRREKRAAAYWSAEFSIIDSSAAPAQVQAAVPIEP
jgi:hypothetical protein